MKLGSKNKKHLRGSTHNTPLGHHTDRGPMGLGQYNSLGEYCGLSTASEVFLLLLGPITPTQDSADVAVGAGSERCDEELGAPRVGGQELLHQVVPHVQPAHRRPVRTRYHGYGLRGRHAHPSQVHLL